MELELGWGRAVVVDVVVAEVVVVYMGWKPMLDKMGPRLGVCVLGGVTYSCSCTGLLVVGVSTVGGPGTKVTGA